MSVPQMYQNSSSNLLPSWKGSLHLSLLLPQNEVEHTHTHTFHNDISSSHIITYYNLSHEMVEKSWNYICTSINIINSTSTVITAVSTQGTCSFTIC